MIWCNVIWSLVVFFSKKKMEQKKDCVCVCKRVLMFVLKDTMPSIYLLLVCLLVSLVSNVIKWSKKTKWRSWLELLYSANNIPIKRKKIEASLYQKNNIHSFIYVLDWKFIVCCCLCIHELNMVANLNNTGGHVFFLNLMMFFNWVLFFL